jgi:hypothetical protein
MSKSVTHTDELCEGNRQGIALPDTLYFGEQVLGRLFFKYPLTTLADALNFNIAVATNMSARKLRIVFLLLCKL